MAPNNLLQLDILEYGHGVGSHRYKKTKDICESMKRRNLFPTKEQAELEVLELKKLIIEKKIYFAEQKLRNAIKKTVKGGSKKLEILAKVFDPATVEVIVKQKIIKSIQKLFVKNVKEIPEYLPKWVIKALQSKDDIYSPGKFYKESNDEIRKALSNVFNNKTVIETVKLYENNFKILNGPVKRERAGENSKKAAGKTVDGSGNEDEEDEEEDEDEDEDEEEASEEEADYEDREEGVSGRKVDFEVNEDDDEYSQYDNLVVASGSSDEEEDEEKEGAEEDEFFDFSKSEEKAKKPAGKLPALQSGYISGGSDSDSEDELVKEITKPRKNRRGQRARQKIWEQKFGKKANHVQKENAKIQSERQRKQEEYEERVKKRAAKAKLDKDNANNIPLGDRKIKKPQVPIEDRPFHPSWEAKRKAEKELSAKFQGKKIKF